MLELRGVIHKYQLHKKYGCSLGNTPHAKYGCLLGNTLDANNGTNNTSNSQGKAEYTDNSDSGINVQCDVVIINNIY